MSDNSNDPRQRISSEELGNTKINLEVHSYAIVAHVFFGPTPRAQLSIEFLKPINGLAETHLRGVKRTLQGQFSPKEISIQS